MFLTVPSSSPPHFVTVPSDGKWKSYLGIVVLGRDDEVEDEGEEDIRASISLSQEAPGKWRDDGEIVSCTHFSVQGGIYC